MHPPLAKMKIQNDIVTFRSSLKSSKFDTSKPKQKSIDKDEKWKLTEGESLK